MPKNFNTWREASHSCTVRSYRWLPWLEENFGWSQPTAFNYMRVAEAFNKLSTVDNLTIDASALYLLAKPDVLIAKLKSRRLRSCYSQRL